MAKWHGTVLHAVVLAYSEAKNFCAMFSNFLRRFPRVRLATPILAAAEHKPHWGILDLPERDV